jgi:DNA (cytosine-5)-methyltransferase 1
VAGEFRVVPKGKYGVRIKRSDSLELPPAEGGCTPETFAEWVGRRKDNELLAVDLFSGAGGLSLGLERAGWTVAAAVDADDRALETHAHNFSGLSLKMDLGDPAERDALVDLIGGTKIDLVAGGPPCQPFSRAGRSKIRSLVKEGKRDPHDHRKELWMAYLDIVSRLSPRAVLMENVPDMGFGDDFFVVRCIEQALEEAGYATQVRLVDAWNYGVPQHRKRLILLARKDVQEFTWPAPEARKTTLLDAIGDLPELDVDNKDYGGRERPYRMPRNISPFAREMRRGAKKGLIHDHMTRAVRDDDKVIFEYMDSKTLYADLPAEYRRYSAEHFTDKYKKLDWGELSRSITAHIAKDGYWYIHPEQPRTLSVREAARVQTFPDGFRFAGTRSDAFRQIGNAVPPLLGEAAAKALKPTDADRTVVGGLKPYWLEVREDLTLWAEKERKNGHWYHLPGEHLAPLHAAVAAVLGSARRTTAVARTMGIVRALTRLDASTFQKVIESAPSQGVRRSLEKLAPLVDNDEIWEEPLELPTALGLTPNESSLYRLLVGEDLLLVNQGPIRVAARFSGSEANRKNRLSDGRVDLAKLVGAGEEAPLRMAAIRLVGMTMCREQPFCLACPLRNYCSEYRKNADVVLDDADGEVTEARPQLF